MGLLDEVLRYQQLKFCTPLNYLLLCYPFLVSELSQMARRVFRETLAALDPARAVRRAARWQGDALDIAGQRIQAPPSRPVYAVALGKAARLMAQTLDEILGPRLAGGVISLPESEARLITPGAGRDWGRWQIFGGGHPLPNAESWRAAQAAFALLRRADAERAVVIFLISGGGSAMMELPRDERLTLAELKKINRALVECGATIAEINAVRRALSAVKGGGLARAAPRAEQISLIISDTNPGDFASVASGPTCAPRPGDPQAAEVLSRYNLWDTMPPPAAAALRRTAETQPVPNGARVVLLDQNDALAAASGSAEKLGFAAEIAGEIVEQPVEVGVKMLLERLLEQMRKHAGAAVGVLSAGEFSCPVRGVGQGGRNSETALRMTLLLHEHQVKLEGWQVAFLSAGTDGVDGNSPAAGASCAPDTVTRAAAMGLDASQFLANSDSYSFFNSLGDALETGPTGTNVRDVRILLARQHTSQYHLR